MIDAFAERNIPIRTMERASGFISTEQLAAGSGTGSLADCGSMLGLKLPAHRATYNVIVRGDSAQSTAKATVRWVNEGRGECVSTGEWETGFELRVKARAEGRP